MMQALFAVIINASALYVSLYSPKESHPLDIVGAVVFGFGFLTEVIADYQLQKFRDNPLLKG